MCYSVFGMVHIKDPLLLRVAHGVVVSFLTIGGHLSCVRHHITVNKMC